MIKELKTQKQRIINTETKNYKQRIINTETKFVIPFHNLLLKYKETNIIIRFK